MKTRSRELNQHYFRRYDPEHVTDLVRELGEEDARIAAKALEDDDLVTAYHATAGALLVDPFEQTWIALLDTALDRDATYLDADLAIEPAVGMDALRAYATWRSGRVGDAVKMIRPLTRDSAARYAEAWAIAWLEPAGIVESLPAQVTIELAMDLAARYPDPPKVDPRGAEPIARMLALLDRVEAKHGASDPIAIQRGVLLARAGRTEEAIVTTERVAEARPTTMTCTAAAMARKRAGDWKGAIRWFERAAALDPKAPFCNLDIGDIHLTQEQYAPALASYEEALRRRPGHDWAEPSAVYCRYRLSNDAVALAELRVMANGARCTCGGAAAIAQLTGGYGYDDRQRRAEYLMRLVEPGFVARPVEIVH